MADGWTQLGGAASEHMCMVEFALLNMCTLQRLNVICMCIHDLLGMCTMEQINLMCVCMYDLMEMCTVEQTKLMVVCMHMCECAHCHELTAN